MHIAEPLVPKPSGFEVGIAVEKLKKYKLAGIDQITAEQIKARGILCFEIHRLNNSIWNKGELSQQWMESVFVTIYKKR